MSDHKHEHGCEHELHYCACCDKIYCCKCKREWGNCNHVWQYTQPTIYPIYTSFRTASTAGDTLTSLTCSHI